MQSLREAPITIVVLTGEYDFSFSLILRQYTLIKSRRAVYCVIAAVGLVYDTYVLIIGTPFHTVCDSVVSLLSDVLVASQQVMSPEALNVSTRWDLKSGFFVLWPQNEGLCV